MFVENVTAEVFASLEPRAAVCFRAQIRSVLALFVKFVRVRLKFRFGFESKLAQFTDKVARMRLYMDGVVASGLEH